jgi:hypothetical protein
MKNGNASRSLSRYRLGSQKSGSIRRSGDCSLYLPIDLYRPDETERPICFFPSYALSLRSFASLLGKPYARVIQTNAKNAAIRLTNLPVASYTLHARAHHSRRGLPVIARVDARQHCRHLGKHLGRPSLNPRTSCANVAPSQRCRFRVSTRPVVRFDVR